jgi:hypothetical protein
MIKFIHNEMAYTGVDDILGRVDVLRSAWAAILLGNGSRL